MKTQNVFALIVAYYLSRYDQEAYINLGYSTKDTAHRDIGTRLDVNPNSVKNMRDEFDAIHENTRVGWYQRDLRPSRKKVVEFFQELSEPELRDIVSEIISNAGIVDPVINEVVDAIQTRGDALSEEGHPYIIRGPTGRRAEEIFIEYHRKSARPYPGELIDTRDLGCGYDFEIRQDIKKYFIEVKGLAAITGGVLFTGKEWEMALNKSDYYYLALISNVREEPEVILIRNPAATLNANRNIHTTVQIRWSVTEIEINRHRTDL